MIGRRFAMLGAVVVLALAGSSTAVGADECRGLMVCVPVAGPWVVVPPSASAPRRTAEWQLSCPRGHVVGGLDARLSVRAIDISFYGALGSPVTPGVTTSRSVIFAGARAGAAGPAPTFRPFIGCMPATGGGTRVPTSVTAFRPGKPSVRYVKTVRVRPGAATVSQACGARERLVGASHAFAFGTSTPPSASLVATVSGTQAVQGGRVVVRVRGDAELQGVKAFVQVHAVCAVAR